MPMGPFLEAFRDVLDERPLVQRELRRGLRWTGTDWWAGLAGQAAADRRRRAGVAGRRRRADLLEVERAGSSVAGRGSTSRASVCGALSGRRAASRCQEALAGQASSAATARLPDIVGARTSFERAAAALALDPALLEEHRAAAGRSSVRSWMPGLGGVPAMAVDVVPAPAWPGVLIVHTGGLGSDVAMAGAAPRRRLAERPPGPSGRVWRSPRAPLDGATGLEDRRRRTGGSSDRRPTPLGPRGGGRIWPPSAIGGPGRGAGSRTGRRRNETGAPMGRLHHDE